MAAGLNGVRTMPEAKLLTLIFKRRKLKCERASQVADGNFGAVVICPASVWDVLMDGGDVNDLSPTSVLLSLSARWMRILWRLLDRPGPLRPCEARQRRGPEPRLLTTIAHKGHSEHDRRGDPHGLRPTHRDPGP